MPLSPQLRIPVVALSIALGLPATGCWNGKTSPSQVGSTTEPMTESTADKTQQLKAWAKESEAVQPKCDHFAAEFARFFKTKTPLKPLRSAADFRGLLTVLKSFPGTPSANQKAFEDFARSKDEYENVHFEELARFRGCNATAYLQAGRTLLASTAAGGVTAADLAETRTVLTDKITHELEAPTSIVMVIINHVLLTDMMVKGLLNASKTSFTELDELRDQSLSAKKELDDQFTGKSLPAEITSWSDLSPEQQEELRERWLFETSEARRLGIRMNRLLKSLLPAS